MSEPILVRREGPVATIVLNRPERLNALDLASWRRLGEAAAGLDADESLRCILIRGAGEKAFAAGADISAFARERASVEQARIYGEAMHVALRAVAECRHPTVAVIRGVNAEPGDETGAIADMVAHGATLFQTAH